MTTQHTGRRWSALQIIGTVVAALLQLLSLTIWWGYITSTAGGYHPYGLDGQMVLLIFLLWFVLGAIATGLMIAAFRLRHILPRIGIGLLSVMTVVGIVTAIVGAQ